MKTSGFILILVFLGCFTGMALAEQDVAGSVKLVKGDVIIIHNGENVKAESGWRLFQDDTLKTGSDGSMGVIFRDNSTLSLGPDTTIVIDEFIFSPIEGKLGMVNRMAKGTAVFLSGEITKLSPEAVKFETPLATIGIRGTRFMVKVD